MRILMALNAPWVGGTRIHVLTLAQALLERGHRLTLVTDGGLLEEEMSTRGIPFVRRVEGLPAMLDLLLDLVEREKPDLIHAHPAESILESYLLGQITKIPVLVTMHGEYLMHFNRSALGARIGTAVRAVIAVSEGVRGFLLTATDLPPDKLFVVPNPIDVEAYHPRPVAAELRSALGLRPEDYVVMYLGRLERDKEGSIMAAAAAVRLLAGYGAGVRGVFVGSGSMVPALTEISCRMRAESGLPPLVLTGFRRDLPEMLSLADVVVAAGRSALEAAAAGKPVLASGRAGFLGLLTPENWPAALATNFGDHGSLPPPDPIALADQVHFIRRQAGRLDSIPIMRQLIADHFSPNHVATQVERIYREAIEHNG